MTAVGLQKKSNRSVFKVENTDSQRPKYGFVDKDGVYQLSDAQLESIEISEQQILKGEYIDADEMDKLVEAWANEE